MSWVQTTGRARKHGNQTFGFETRPRLPSPYRCMLLAPTISNLISNQYICRTTI